MMSSGKSISSAMASGFQLGDRVADLTVLGSNAAYRTLRADRLTRVPAGVDAAG
jgi:NADPH:quinone reductase